MKKYSKSWKASKKPNKQRKYQLNAPLHIKGKMLGCHLSKNLREKHKKRTIRLKKGDKVKIVRGSHKSKTGKVERIQSKTKKAYITGIEATKKDGSKIQLPISISNLIITELDLSDKKRMKAQK